MRFLPAFSIALCVIPAIACAQDIKSEAAISIDAATGKVLWQKNGDEELYPASTTKIMTALLLMEHCRPDQLLTAPADVQKVSPSSMHLWPHETVTAHDMLYALMLRSANDGAYTVACNLAGNVPNFAAMMNARARQLGCTHTHFHNPNGLDDTLHYTTAHDLALIAREAMTYPEFRKAVATHRYKIARSKNKRDEWMVNHDRIPLYDHTCDGIKTGWTVPAGHCFVGTADRNGWRVITVVLKSKNWKKDTEDLYNWSFSHFNAVQVVRQGDQEATASVRGGTIGTVPVVAASAASVVSRDSAGFTKQLVLSSGLKAPLTKGQPLGTLVVKDSDGYAQNVPLVAGADVPSATAPQPAGRPWVPKAVGASALVGAYYVRRRTPLGKNKRWKRAA